MRSLRHCLLLTLLAACDAAEAVFPDDANVLAPDAAVNGPADAGSEGPDAGGWASDAAISSPADAAVAHAPDAGSADTGPFSCVLEPAASAISLNGFQQEYELADLAARDGKVGFAYSWNRKERRLFVAEVASGAQLFKGVIAAFSAGDIPRAIDLAGGVFFVAGNYDTSGQTPYTRVALVDTAGQAKAQAQTNDFVAVAAAREKAGGRVLATGKLVGTAQPIYVNRYDQTGALTGSYEIERNNRRRNEWDLDWAFDSDSGIACGLGSDTQGEVLALFSLSGTSAVEHKSAQRIAAASSTDSATFGCRLARGTDFAAVAFAEGNGAGRLVWLGVDGAAKDGPVPFLSGYASAQKYDVAASGAVTALAYFDESGSVPKVVVKIFEKPAKAPITLNAESDLNLGSFDAIGRRVRLVRIDGGFAVAFDANIKIGQTDLYVRKVLCK